MKNKKQRYTVIGKSLERIGNKMRECGFRLCDFADAVQKTAAVLNNKDKKESDHEQSK